MATPAAPSETLNPNANPFKIKKWNAVALWTWDMVVDTCAICRNHIMNPCIECQSNSEAGGSANACDPAWGQCNHAFHKHCIARWLNTRPVCPLDNQKWQYRESVCDLLQLYHRTPTHPTAGPSRLTIHPFLSRYIAYFPQFCIVVVTAATQVTYN